MKAFAATVSALLLSLAAGTAAAGEFNHQGYGAMGGYNSPYASSSYPAGYGSPYGNRGYSQSNRNTQVLVGAAIGAAVGYIVSNRTQPRGYANGYYSRPYNSGAYGPNSGYGYGSNQGYYNTRGHGRRGW